MSSSNPGSPALPGETFPSAVYLNRVMCQHQPRIFAAYNGDTFWDVFDTAPTYSCHWSGCAKDKAESHGHLHHGVDSAICQWNKCTRRDVHVHKYKPPVDGQSWEADRMTPFDRVKFVVQDILEPQYVTEWLLNNIFNQLGEDRAKRDADNKIKAKRLADAEEAGEEAARRYEERAATRRAAKAKERRKAEEVLDAKKRRSSGRESMRQEFESGNELERHFTESEPTTSPTITQEMRDAQLGVFSRNTDQLTADEPSSTDAEARVPSAVALGKRKRVEGSMPSPSLSDADFVSPDDIFEPEAVPSPERQTDSTALPEIPEMTDEELWGSPQSNSSTFTSYSRDELDAILSGAEVIEEPSPRSAAHNTSSSQEVPASTPPTSTDEEVRRNYGLTTMPPPAAPKLTPAQREERADHRDMVARAGQIAAVMEDEALSQRKKHRWNFKIYEDPDVDEEDP